MNHIYISLLIKESGFFRDRSCGFALVIAIVIWSIDGKEIRVKYIISVIHIIIRVCRKVIDKAGRSVLTDLCLQHFIILNNIHQVPYMVFIECMRVIFTQFTSITHNPKGEVQILASNANPVSLSLNKHVSFLFA